MNEYNPDTHSKPGDTLIEILDVRGISRGDLAMQMMCSIPKIERLLSGEDWITPEIASKLENALSISAHFWVNRELIYREWLSRKPEKKSEKEA